jgi:enterochelin esterase-like enzyme
LSSNDKEVKLWFEGKGTVLDQTFASRILNREVLYRVYLPPGYATSQQRYPVLYMLHGRNANYEQWTEYGLLKLADQLILAKKIQPFIIVMPEGEFSYWMNHANGGPRWGDYLAIDLVEHIDSTFRSLPNPANRAIGGLSMGGHGALQVGINYPEVFSIIGAHSPALRTKEQAFDFWGDDEYFATIDPFTLTQTLDLSAYKIWLDIGQDDKDWSPRAIEFHQLLVTEGVPHTWNLWSGGHNAEYWASHVKDYLLFYSNSFAGDNILPG